MKSFPSDFEAKKNSPTGSPPVWILELAFGDYTIYLSDYSFPCTFGRTVVQIKPWIKSWGELKEGVDKSLGDFSIADISIDCINDPDDAENLLYWVTNFTAEQSPAKIYLWFTDSSDDPQQFFQGYIKDYPFADDYTCTLKIQDESMKLETMYLSEKITTDTYPDADPDDVGRVVPIIFGSVEKLKTLAIEAGIQTSLPDAIAADATSFYVSDGTGLTAGKVITIDSENIYIKSIDGDQITSCTRGYDDTIAATHWMGAIVWENRTSFVYLVSNQPDVTVNKVYGKVGDAVMDISEVVTVYNGTHDTYPGKTVISVPGYITVEQMVDILAHDGITVTDEQALTGDVTLMGMINAWFNAIASGSTSLDMSSFGVSEGSHDHGSMSTYTSQPAGVSVAVSAWVTKSSEGGEVIDQNDTTYVTVQDTNKSTGTAKVTVTFPAWAGGDVTAFTVWVKERHSNTSQARISGYDNIGSYRDLADASSAKTQGYKIVSTTVPSSLYLYFKGSSSGNFLAEVYSVWIEVESSVTANSAALGVDTEGHIVPNTSVDTSQSSVGSNNGTLDTNNTVDLWGAGAGKDGTVTLYGNSTANTLVGDEILVDVTAPKTYPSDVFSYILGLCNDTWTFSLKGDMPSEYTLNGAITEYKTALYWLNYLAFQCRSRFRMHLGQGLLIVRPDAYSSVKTISSCAIDSTGKRVLSRDRTPYDDLINTITVLYNRDYSLTTRDDSSYKSSKKDQDDTSIGLYGECEQPDLFYFDFVKDDDMAADLLAFYLSYYAYRRWIYEFESFLKDCELEFMDDVTLGFLNSVVCELIGAAFSPGDRNNIDRIKLTAIA